jgi:hypothetical protein
VGIGVDLAGARLKRVDGSDRAQGPGPLDRHRFSLYDFESPVVDIGRHLTRL